MAYMPEQPPSDPNGLPMFLANELRKIQQAMVQTVPLIVLEQLNVAPTKPRTGMVVLADGTNWNPGSGAGFYGYYGAAWVKLG